MLPEFRNDPETPATTFMPTDALPVFEISPLLMRALFELSWTAKLPTDTSTLPPDPIVTLPGLEFAAVAVETAEVVREEMVRSSAMAGRMSAAAMLAVMKTLRFIMPGPHG